MCRVKRLCKPSLLVVVLFTALFLPGAIDAQDCAEMYTVRPGDTLSAIAVWHHTTVRALVNLNHIQNPNLIRPGQALCVPAQTPKQPSEVLKGATATTPQNKLVIEVDYAYQTPDDERVWTLKPEGRTRIRVDFPLSASDDVVDARADPDRLIEALIPNTAPVRLWISHPSPALQTYVLTVVGDESVFAALHLQRPAPGDRVAVEQLQLLPDSGLTRVITTTVWLAADSGELYPLPISHLAYARTVTAAKEGFSNVRLALLSDGAGAYKIRMVLTEDVWPGPSSNIPRCALISIRNRFTGCLRRFLRCPP